PCLPYEALGIDRIIAAHRSVGRLAHLPGNAGERFGPRVEPPDAVGPVLRAPDDVVPVGINPMGAGQHTFGDPRDVEFLDGAGHGIEPADVRAAVGRVPQVTL